MNAPPVLAIVGPTATGKTALAVALARQLGGEVVNADSMQLYRGMDVGTAKPTPAERGGIAHHLLDIWPVTAPASVADYQARAVDTIDSLRARGVPPLLVGGSGLYVRAVLEQLAFPGTDPELRAELEAELAEHGPAVLHARLAAQDPQAAAVVLPTNGRRVVRALEVVALTGSFTATLPAPGQLRWPTRVLGLDTDDPTLDSRVEQRVARMLQAGLIEEVDRLVADGLREGPTARKALGYAQVLAWRDGALPDREAVAQRTAAVTRRFVRRQRSWFRRDPQIRWLDATAPDLVERARAALAA